MNKKSTPAIQRVLAKVVESEDGCWNFTGARSDGYGVISIKVAGTRRMRNTHRVVYEHLVGPVPPGLELDHLCRNRACCNPAHLEPVTHSTNMRRGLRKTQQTHCKQGHPLSGDNLRITNNRRDCKTCNRAAVKRYKQRISEGKAS